MRAKAGMILLIAILSGCVSRQTLEQSETALGACRQEVDACRTAAATQVEQAKTALGVCRQDVDRCKERGAAQLEVCMQVRRSLETDAARLNQEIASCGKDVLALRGRAQAELVSCVDMRRKAEAQLAKTGHELVTCREEVSVTLASARSLEERATQLRQRLKTEIADKNVEIEQLRDKLSVRVLDRILFPSGSADILPEGRAVLEKLAAVFAGTDDLIRVEGHTDNVPIGRQLKEKYPSNWELSTARASSVVRYFEQEREISPLRMEAVGFSKFRPVAPGDLLEDQQRNRRVEIVLSAPRAP